MVNWLSAGTLLHQAVSLQKATLVLSGIYFYDFTLSLPYDWDIINKPYAKAVTLIGNGLYLLCRYLVFASCVCSCLIVGSFKTINCQALLKLDVFTGAIGIASASSLLFVRAGVIWKWNRWVVSCLVPFVVAIYVCGIRTTVAITSVYDPLIGQCTLDDIVQDRSISIAALCGDSTLVVFILVGLQKGWRGARRFPLWITLWKQGLLYLALAITVEVPLLVFLWLNLNQIMNTLFIVPSVVMMAVGATRFHRALTGHSGKGIPSYNTPAIQPLEPHSFELAEISRAAPAHDLRVLPTSDLV